MKIASAKKNKKNILVIKLYDNLSSGSYPSFWKKMSSGLTNSWTTYQNESPNKYWGYIELSCFSCWTIYFDNSQNGTENEQRNSMTIKEKNMNKLSSVEYTKKKLFTVSWKVSNIINDFNIFKINTNERTQEQILIKSISSAVLISSV